jgi:hypothetical protein
MSFQNHLRLGGFDQTVAFLLYRRRIGWVREEAHLDLTIAQGLFISRMRHLAGEDLFEFVSSTRRSYDLKLILEPRPGTPEPVIGGGGGLHTGHPFIVDWRHTGLCVRRALTALGMNVANQQVVYRRVVGELARQKRQNGF